MFSLYEYFSVTGLARDLKSMLILCWLVPDDFSTTQHEWGFHVRDSI